MGGARDTRPYGIWGFGEEEDCDRFFEMIGGEGGCDRASGMVI